MNTCLQNISSIMKITKKTVVKYGCHLYVTLVTMITIEIKNSSSYEMLKNKSKWQPNGCEWKLCQDYLYRIGYINLVDS